MTRNQAAAELVASARCGDGRALDTLVRDVIVPTVWATCLSMVGGRSRWSHDPAVDVDDIAQLAAFAAVRALRRFEGRDGASFVTYVRGITRNKVADALVADARNRAVTLAELPDSADAALRPDEAAERADEIADAAAEVDRLLAGLTPLGRDVLMMRLGHQLSPREVAAVLRTTPGAVRVAQHRALNAVRAASERAA